MKASELDLEEDVELEVDEEEEEEDHYAEVEEDLSEALSLLEDCTSLLLELADPYHHIPMPWKMRNNLFKLTAESQAFLDQYDMREVIAPELLNKPFD